MADHTSIGEYGRNGVLVARLARRARLWQVLGTRRNWRGGMVGAGNHYEYWQI